MRDEKFRSRDKRVQKLGRDGLVEKNQATGEERRVSRRAADISFDRRQEPEMEARQSRTQQKKRRKKQPPVPQGPEPLLASTADSQSIPDGGTAEPPALSMREASDMPVAALPPDTGQEPSEKPRRRRGRGKRKVTEKRVNGHEEGVVPSAPAQKRDEGKKRQKDVFDSQHQAEQERTAGAEQDLSPTPQEPKSAPTRSGDPSPLRQKSPARERPTETTRHSHKRQKPTVPEQPAPRIFFDEDSPQLETQEQPPSPADAKPKRKHLRFEDTPEEEAPPEKAPPERCLSLAGGVSRGNIIRRNTV